MHYNYIIVEDNQGAQANLKTALHSFDEFQYLGSAQTAHEGIAMTLSHRPHLVFLDVELGSENGFEVIREIRQFTDELPYFIMTTNYDKYAKEAVNKDVLYFLDKPIDPDELAIALSKVKKRYAGVQEQIIIKNTGGHFFINLKTIQYIEASGSSCKIYQAGGSVMCVTRTLKDLEEVLPSRFVRIHKSYVIQKNHLKLFNIAKRFIIINCEQQQVKLPIGLSYLDKVKNILLRG